MDNDFDIVLKNGVVVDGTGNPWFKANIAVKDGKIAEISNKNFEAKKVIDAQGCVICPGFIDMHSHSDFVLMVNPKAESKIRQGVTTEVVGNCGDSAAPAKSKIAQERARNILGTYGLVLDWFSYPDYLNKLDRGVALNVATLVGHGTIRRSILGLDNRPPKKEEMAMMKDLVKEAMEVGAFGMSSGLVYPPGRYANTAELIELCEVVSKYGGIYTSHIRGERETMIEAVKESIEIGEKASVSVQISHHPAKIGAWGKSKDTLNLIDEARSRGLEINCDLHTYLAGSTGLSALLPPWVQEGGDGKITERLRNPETRKKVKEDMIREEIPGPGPCGLVKRGMWKQIVLSSCEKNKELIGKNFDEIARLRGNKPFDAYFDLLIEEDTLGSIVGFYYNEDDIRRVLKHPVSMIGSDGNALSPYGVLGKGKSHPRSYGAFPMVFRKYVMGKTRKDLKGDVGKKILRIEEAVRKTTSLPAQKLGIGDRGLLRNGMWADIAIINTEKISDRATYLQPYQYPVGIEYVIVNGKVVMEKDEHLGILPGKVLRFHQ